jgi:hypothetical protein
MLAMLLAMLLAPAVLAIAHAHVLRLKERRVSADLR